MSTAPLRFAATYCDGRSSRALPVSVLADGDRLRIEGEGLAREASLRAASVSEQLGRAPRSVSFADGAFFETADHQAFARMLAAAGRREGFIARWQSRWQYALLALAATVAVLWLGYAYGLPRFAALAAQRVPPDVEAAIGRHAAAAIDKRLFAPTRLPAERRAALAARFAALAPQDGRAYRLEFRQSSIGPNALALPGGVIVMTDELVQIAPSDEAIVAVLAHELGHIEHRHFLRRLISSTVTGAVATLIAGDASGVLTALPATLAELSYARDQEREADRFAIALLRANGIAPEALAQALEALERAHRTDEPRRTEAAKSSGRSWSDYVSTHPATDERVAEIRAAR